MEPAPVPVANTWDDVERLMYADEPVNFLLKGDLIGALSFHFPRGREVVDVLRKDPDARILPGRPTTAASCPKMETNAGEVAILETRDGVSHLKASNENKFAEWFRTAPLDEVIAAPFSIAHFQLAKFFEPGKFLEGFDVAVVEPWKASLRDAGFSFDRCLPYIFISGVRDVGAFHHDVSHVVAWQVEGTKRFCGYRRPRTLHGEAKRRKHGQEVALPPDLTEADVLAVDMPPGTVLFNQLLTPHWVQSPHDALAFSVNFSHGGLKRDGRGLCVNEEEHEAYKASDPAIAEKFDIKKGWKPSWKSDEAPTK